MKGLLQACFYSILAIQLFNTSTFGQSANKPNVVIIFADDMGYGDMGAFGHPTIMTPNLDRMAFEGQRWTNFYVAAPVCTPSRAGLLTGRLPVRSGMASDKRRVLFPDSKGGLPSTEITIAKQLKKVGYSTAMVGKWHLGHLPEFDPLSHGFDSYFGIPYSNDMDYVGKAYGKIRFEVPVTHDYNVPLKRNRETVEQPTDQTTISKRYTEEAVKYIKSKKDKPFFLYLAHSMPHVPLFRSKDFEDKSLRGLYGDVIEELDWSVGEVLNSLRETGQDKNTMVVFTSDNGPWLVYEELGGSAGILKGGKGGTFEGGMREPTIMWWPGKIKPGVRAEIGSTLDLLPTISGLVGAPLPKDRIYDGYDLSSVIFGSGKSPRNEIYYYRDEEVYAVRMGAYKVHFITRAEYGNNDKVIHFPPLLYNLNVDPSEKYNIAKEHPEVVSQAREMLEKHQKSVVPVINQLEIH